MNSFSGLRQEKTDPNDTIETVKQLRNQKKKLRNLERKEDTPENLRKRKRIESAIKEYDNKGNPQKEQEKQKKQKQKQTTNDDDDFLEKAFQEANTPEYKQEKQDAEDERQRKKDEWETNRRQREQQALKEREERGKRQRQEEEERQERRRQRKERQRQEEEERQERQRQQEKKSKLHDLLKQHNAPEDIISLANNYEETRFKKLILIYHPDRKKGTEDLGMCLNYIRDHYNPKVHEYDETWVK